MTTWRMDASDDARNERNAKALQRIAAYLNGLGRIRFTYDCPKTFFQCRFRSVSELLAYANSPPIAPRHTAECVKRWFDHAVSSFAENCAVEAGAQAACNGADASYDVMIEGERVDLKVTSLLVDDIAALKEGQVVRKLLAGVMDPNRDEHQNKAYIIVAREAGVTTAEAKSHLLAVKVAARALVEDWGSLVRVPLHAGEPWFGVVVVVDEQGQRIRLN